MIHFWCWVGSGRTGKAQGSEYNADGILVNQIILDISKRFYFSHIGPDPLVIKK